MSANTARVDVLAFGHENVLAIHPSTLMFTKEKHLSKTGDCIIAVAADRSVADLSVDFKNELRKPTAKLTIIIKAGDLTEQVNAFGSPKLVLTDPTDMVIRKSSYICSRTLAIHADKAANDLPRALIEKLKNPKNKVKISFFVR